jgi:hypothetical protein
MTSIARGIGAEVTASRMLDRDSVRQLAAAMALVMTLASLPSIGVIIVADRSGPSISMDICHPLQSLETSSGTVLVARPARPELGTKLVSDEPVFQFVPILKSKFAEAPDPPPPKLFC